MAKMFKYSRDADVYQLNIFDTPATNTSVKAINYIHLPCKSRLDGDTLEWTFSRNDLSYYDLRKLKLTLKCKIVDSKGNPADPADVAFPTNHLLRTLWKKVDVYFGGEIVTGTEDNFHYKSMIRTLLYNVRAVPDKYKLASEFFFEDAPAGFDWLKDNDDPSIMYNDGADIRTKISSDGQTFTLEGSLGIDVFELDNYMINGVEMKLKLTRNDHPITIMSDNKDKKYEIHLADATLKVPTIKVGAAIVTGHDEGLKHGGMAQYFFKQSKIKRTNVNPYVTSFSTEVHNGKTIPERVVVVFVDQDRYDGKYHLNPFRFDHLNISSIRLRVNSKTIPSEEERYDFSKKSFVQALNNLYSVESNFLINRDTFDKGYSIFVFDLTVGEDSSDQLLLQSSGDVELEVKFQEPVPVGYTALIYSEFQSCIQIDHLRKVYYSGLN